jgi:hypothetical protein
MTTRSARTSGTSTSGRRNENFEVEAVMGAI